MRTVYMPDNRMHFTTNCMQLCDSAKRSLWTFNRQLGEIFAKSLASCSHKTRVSLKNSRFPEHLGEALRLLTCVEQLTTCYLYPSEEVKSGWAKRSHETNAAVMANKNPFKRIWILQFRQNKSWVWKEATSDKPFMFFFKNSHICNIWICLYNKYNYNKNSHLFIFENMWIQGLTIVRSAGNTRVS